MDHPSHANTLSQRSAAAAGQAKCLATTLTSAATGSLLALALLVPTAARAVDGCLVLLCFAAPSWKAIPQCVPPIRQVLRDLARGKGFPSCGMSGAGNSAYHAWARAPGNCPPQYTRVHESESGPIYTCDYSGAVSVSIEGKPFTRTWWNMSGNTVTDFSPTAKAQLGSWDTQFDDEHAAWKATLPPAPTADAGY
ncbi:MAG TPA: hypothetical protein DCY64_17250 [Hydrogenophaga sp.]|nr:MAG: hypothetical protein A2X73_06515 [Burkholderiales bacterium GWE1_65_30]OGA92969.1 MAG: hypothetical protein A2X72_22010 [Burkholderiales bacterium GWF1_66_17]HAX22012.1 hypothetical protein [Hydrogenophaga sp.]HBU21162.1 hypothetical protein [Hydrogenophaga sp.]